MVLNPVQTDPREVILDAVEARAPNLPRATSRQDPAAVPTARPAPQKPFSPIPARPQVCEETCGSLDLGPMIVVRLSELPESVEARS